MTPRGARKCYQIVVTWPDKRDGHMTREVACNVAVRLREENRGMRTAVRELPRRVANRRAAGAKKKGR